MSLTELELYKKREHKKTLRSHAHRSWETAANDQYYDTPPVVAAPPPPPGTAPTRKTLLSACRTLVKNIFTRRKV